MTTSLARLVVFFTLLLSASNANALSMKFINEGANIDDDPINDIVVAPGEMIVFQNRWTDAVPFSEFNGFEYLITYDTNELTLEHVRLDKNNHAVGENWFPVANGQLQVIHPQNSNNNALFFPFSRIWIGDEFTFKVVRPKNDGLPDYSLKGTVLFTNAGIVNWPAQNIQEVEVQPVPAPLPILPLFVMWSQRKKLRRISCRLR